MTAVTETPLMQQYRDIKARHQQDILFFRMGDFYEMFEDDAKLAARELGLTLTSRNNGGAAEVPLAGVPVKAATDYLRRLIAKGHSVAICEQVEDPKLAKGVVRRAVVETVTPGTVLSEDWLDRNRNNYLVAVDPRGANAGIAGLDLTTGELILEVVPASELELALARYEARELVLPAETTITAPAGTMTAREAWEYDPELAREDLARTYGVASLDGLGIAGEDRPALGAAGGRSRSRAAARSTRRCTRSRAARRPGRAGARHSSRDGRAARFDSAPARCRWCSRRARGTRAIHATRDHRAHARPAHRCGR